MSVPEQTGANELLSINVKEKFYALRFQSYQLGKCVTGSTSQIELKQEEVGGKMPKNQARNDAVGIMSKVIRNCSENSCTKVISREVISDDGTDSRKCIQLNSLISFWQRIR